MRRERNEREDLASLFHYASRLMARMYHRHDHGPHAQRHVYHMIRERGPMPQKELMDLLGVRSASLSELLSKLEQRGLVTRTRNNKDKRGFIVAAREGLELPEKEPGKVRSSFFSCLDEGEQKQLAGFLKKIIASMEQDYPEGDRRREGRCHNRSFGRRKKEELL